MPKATEFGGGVQRNTIQPPVTPKGNKGHTPDSAETLRLQYLTGQIEDSTKDPDGVSFDGLRPLPEVLAELPEPDKYLTE